MLSALPAVLVQLICRALQRQEIFLFARCSRQLLQTCDSTFAFKLAPPVCLGRPSAVLSVTVTARPLLRHLTFSLQSDDSWFNVWGSLSEVSALRALPIHTMICTVDAHRIAEPLLAAPLATLPQLRVIRLIDVKGVDRVLEHLPPFADLQLLDIVIAFRCDQFRELHEKGSFPSVDALARILLCNPAMTCTIRVECAYGHLYVTRDPNWLDRFQAMVQSWDQLKPMLAADRMQICIIGVGMNSN